jgi:hypothetical protein
VSARPEKAAMASRKTENEHVEDEAASRPRRLTTKEYKKELRVLQIELLQLEEWVRH